MIFDIVADKKRQPAECVIKIGTGLEEITDLYPFLSELTVETSRESAAEATLRFETRREENGEWIVQDSGIFAPWQPIRIEAAFGDILEEIMWGYIREIQADYPDDAGSTHVVVVCQDESIKLDREHIRQAWGDEQPISDQLILLEITARHNLTVHPDSQSGQRGLIVLQDSTDIRFLKQRAEANGYELIFRDGMIYFGPMRLEADHQAPILVYAGLDTNCIRISIQDDGHQPDQVAFDIAQTDGAGVVQRTVSPNLPLLGNESADSSQSGLADYVWRLTREGGRNEEETTALAQQRVNEQSMKIKAEGELDGSLYGHVLRVGEPVVVDGLGERYTGIYYVDTVNHQFDMDGYRQTFRLLRNAYGDNIEASQNPLENLL